MLEFTGIFCCQGAQQAEITRGKSIWLTEGSHGYILGRPFADAGNLAEAAEKCVAVNYSLKIDFTGANGAGEGSNGFGARAREADVAELRSGKNLGGRKKMREATGTAERFSKSAYQATGQRGRSFHGNLLAENGTGGEFEAIPTAWHAQPRVSLDGGR
jgi:hypothetical protein